MSPQPPPATPLQAPFCAWCAHQQQIGRLRRLASVKVYRAMWAALAGWCLQQPGRVTLQALDGPLLRRYLDSRSGMAGPGEHPEADDMRRPPSGMQDRSPAPATGPLPGPGAQAQPPEGAASNGQATFAHKALTVRYRLRLIGLVRWVQAHDLARQDPLGAAVAAGQDAPRQRGAAALAWSEASLAAGPALFMAAPDAPGSLGVAMTDRLIAWLLGNAKAPATGRWQNLRDRCALALQLGAGIGPGDLRALRLADVLAPASRAADHVDQADQADHLDPADQAAQADPPAGRPVATASGTAGWWLCVPANGNAPAYRAPVAAWAAGLLQQWLVGRAHWGLPGAVLFPSTRSGKPWGKVAQYRSVRQALVEAGLPDGPGGSFRLRHTFALRQLVHGHAADTVAAWLGVSDPQVMQRYRQALGQALIDHAAHAAHAGLEDSTCALPAWPV